MPVGASSYFILRDERLVLCCTANNFGTDSSGKSCVGCGQVQEEFYGCSDIAIGASGTTSPPPVTPPPSRPAIDAQGTPHAVTFAPAVTVTPAVVTYPPFRPITKQTFGTMKTSPPSQPVTSPPTNDPALTFPPFQPLTRRTAAFPPATSPTQLAAKTYPPFQPITNPPTLAQRTTRISPLYPFTLSPVYTTFQPASAVCRGINSWQGVAELDRYCNEQCPLGNCPPMYCSCSAAATALPPQVTPSLLPWRTSQNPTTAPPSPTTAPPSPTTAPPFPTTAPPSPTTAPPSPTTAPPSPTTAPPSPTTAPPFPTTAPPSPTTGPPSPTVGPPSTARYSGRCYGVHSWQGIPRLDKWCDDNCPLGVCPAQNCACGFPTGVRPTQPSVQSSPAFQSTSGSWTSLTSTVPPGTSSSIRQCRSVGLWAGQPQLDQWCSQTCVQFGCDPQYCSCDPPTTGPASSSPRTSTSCYAVNGWSGVYQLDQWCDSACRTGLCPPMYCACGPSGPVSASPPHSGPVSASPPHSGPVSARPQPATQPPLIPSPASANVLAPGQGQCRAVNTWQGVTELDDWCRAQCARGNCPPAYCHCSP